MAVASGDGAVGAGDRTGGRGDISVESCNAANADAGDRDSQDATDLESQSGADRALFGPDVLVGPV